MWDSTTKLQLTMKTATTTMLSVKVFLAINNLPEYNWTVNHRASHEIRA